MTQAEAYLHSDTENCLMSLGKWVNSTALMNSVIPFVLNGCADV